MSQGENRFAACGSSYQGSVAGLFFALDLNQSAINEPQVAVHAVVGPNVRTVGVVPPLRAALSRSKQGARLIFCGDANTLKSEERLPRQGQPLLLC